MTLDGIGQKLPRTTAQNFSQRILKCTWLGELNDIILGHGVSSFKQYYSEPCHSEHDRNVRQTASPHRSFRADTLFVGLIFSRPNLRAAHAGIAADGQPLLADQGHEISQPLTASVRCSR